MVGARWDQITQILHNLCQRIGQKVCTLISSIPARCLSHYHFPPTVKDMFHFPLCPHTAKLAQMDPMGQFAVFCIAQDETKLNQSLQDTCHNSWPALAHF